MKKLKLYAVLFISVFIYSTQSAHSQPDTTPFLKNRISLGVLDMAFGEFGVKYERLFGNGQAGIFVPMNIAYYDGNMYDYSSDFYSGLGLNFYPTGQGTWKYYCGVETNVGYGTFEHSYDYWDPYWGYNHYQYSEHSGFYTRFLINNGVIYSPTLNFSVNMQLGLGFRNAFIDKLTKDERISPNASLGLNLSYRFK